MSLKRTSSWNKVKNAFPLSPSGAWRRKESSRESRARDTPTPANIDAFDDKAGSLSPDSPRSEQDDQVVISKRGEEDFECDFAAPSKGKRARAVMQLMTSGRVAPILEERDVFQLYIGGYSEDFVNERNILHTKVLPHVARWCLDAGIEFDVVDMMHCTNDNIPPGPSVGSVCKHEALSSMRKSSFGLKYISFIGNKLGPRPLPEKLSRNLREEIMHSAQSEEDKELVRSWYVPDPLSASQLQFCLRSPMYASKEMQSGADLDDLSPEDKLDAAERYVAIDRNLRRILTQAELVTRHPFLKPKSLLETELDIFLGSGASAEPAASGGHTHHKNSPDNTRADSPQGHEVAKKDGGDAFGASKCMMVLRMLRGIVEQDKAAKRFQDLLSAERQDSGSAEMSPDPDCSRLIEWLHHSGAREYMGAAQEKMLRATLNWQSAGVSLYHPQFESYFLAFEDKAMGLIKESLDHDLKIRTARQIEMASLQADEGAPGLLHEIRAHAQHVQRLQAKFQLPEVDIVLKKLCKPATGHTRPLFLFGAVGSGKTGIMAAVSNKLGELEQQRAQADRGFDGHKSALESFNLSYSSEPPAAGEIPRAGSSMNFDVGDRPRVVITRFCNISAHSRSARGVLASIAAQLEWVIANVGGGMAQKSEGLFEQAPHQMSYEALTLYLPMVMRHAGKQADIVILIDGLEECAPEHHPERNVRWIPTKLPPNVRLVVSLTGSVSPLAEPDPYAIIGQKIAAGLEACCHVIKDRIRDRFMSVKDVVEVQSMKAALKRDLTDHLLSSNNRRLSKEVEEQFGHTGESSLMIFYSLSMRFMGWVPSSTDGQDLPKPRSLRSLLDIIFENLVGHHGEAIVEWTFGFFCSSYPLGLTEMELLDLLSTCDPVLVQQQETGYKPPQKRVSRRQWAALKSDLVAIGLLFETSCHYGAALSFSHVILAAIVSERLVTRDTMVTCLKNLVGLYSGKLKGTMEGRLVMSCVCDAHLGPSLIYPNTAAQRGTDEGNVLVEPTTPRGAGIPPMKGRPSGQRCAVMKTGGGCNKRRLSMLPATLGKLNEITKGSFADTLTSLLTEPIFLEMHCKTGLQEEMFNTVASAMHSISRSPGNRAVHEDCLGRLALLVAANPFLSGTSTFGIHSSANPSGYDFHHEYGENQGTQSTSVTLPIHAHVSENSKASGEGNGMEKTQSKRLIVLKMEQVKERLMEWEVERYTVLCLKIKEKLREKVRIPEIGSLEPIPDIASIKNLRIERKMQLDFSSSIEAKAGYELSWTSHSVLKEECLQMKSLRYNSVSIQPLLITFLKGFVKVLSQTQVILLLRTHLCTDYADNEAWQQAVQPQLTQIYRDKEEISLLLRDLTSLEDGVTDVPMKHAALVHMRWLIHHHASRSELEQYLAEVRWISIANKQNIFARVRKYNEIAEHQDTCTHDTLDSEIHWGSFLTSSVTSSYTSLGLMSMTDHQIDNELEDIRLQANMEEHLWEDDGFAFHNAVHDLLTKVVEATGTDFARKDAAHSIQSAREATFRKRMPTSKHAQTLFAQYDAVQQASLEQLNYIATVNKEAKVGGTKPEIDKQLKELFDAVTSQRLTQIDICLKNLVESHCPRLREILRDPGKLRLIRNEKFSKTMKEDAAGRYVIDFGTDKLTSLYSLRIISMRRARRRILGILNFFTILERQMSLAVALLGEADTQGPENENPFAGIQSQEILDEMINMHHHVSIDDEGVLHAVDNEGEHVIYDHAFNQLFQVEAMVLISATQMIAPAVRESIPDKPKALHDYLQCELALHEAKLRLITVLLDVLQHSTEVNERRENIQHIIDAMNIRTPVNHGSPYFASTYNLQIEVLNKQAELLANVLQRQSAVERDYVSKIHAQKTPGARLAGFPLPCVPPYLLSLIMSSQSSSFCIFPEPPAPQRPPPKKRQDFQEEEAMSEHDVTGPALASLSMKQTRSEVLPSLGSTPLVLKECKRIGLELAASFTGMKSGIVCLAFHLSMVEEAKQLFEAHRMQRESGETHNPQVDDEESGETLSAYDLPQQMQMSPINNPVAVETLLDSQGIKQTLSMASQGTKCIQGQGLRNILRTLELVHRRWRLVTEIWEIEVLNKATQKFMRDFCLSAAARSGECEQQDMNKEESTFRLGHSVDILPLPTALMQAVGLMKQEIDIDFLTTSGVNALLQTPVVQQTTSEDVVDTLGHLLQLTLLHKHMLAVALEYNASHQDAMLSLHNLRIQENDQLLNSGLQSAWKIWMDGSVKPPPKSTPQLTRHKTSRTRTLSMAVGTTEENHKTEECGKKNAALRTSAIEAPRWPVLPPRWPLLDLSPTEVYRERLFDTKLTSEHIQRMALNVATIPHEAPLSERIERLTEVICVELELPLLSVQGMKEAERLTAFCEETPEIQMIFKVGPWHRDAKDVMGPVMEEKRRGVFSVNLWRIPLAIEFFHDMCLDRAEFSSYVTALGALYDLLNLFKFQAVCAGEPAAAVSEQMRLQVVRFRNRILLNIKSNVVPPRVVASYLVQTRANIITSQLLALHVSRGAFLLDKNMKAAWLSRYMYLQFLKTLTSCKTAILKGLPAFKSDVLRRRWGNYMHRQAFCGSFVFLLKQLHVDERKILERELHHIEDSVNACLSSNNVYPKRQMQLGADLTGEYLADVMHIERIKTQLVFQIAGLCEPKTCEQVKEVKATFERFLKKISSSHDENAILEDTVNQPPTLPENSSLEGEQSDRGSEEVADEADASTEDTEAKNEGTVHNAIFLTSGFRKTEAGTGIDTGLRNRVSTLKIKLEHFLLHQNQQAVRSAADSLINTTDCKLEATASCSDEDFYPNSSSPIGSSPGGSVAPERPEALWKDFLREIVQLQQEQQEESQADNTREIVVNMSKGALFHLLRATDHKLSAWIEDRQSRKCKDVAEQVEELGIKLLGMEREGKFVDDVLGRINASRQRQAFQKVLEQYGSSVYALTQMTKVWDQTERRCMQHKHDIEEQVAADLDSSVSKVKGELSMVRGNLYSVCQKQKRAMTRDLYMSIFEEKASIGPMVNRRVRELNTQNMAAKHGMHSLELAQAKQQELEREVLLNQKHLSLDVAFLKFKLCIRASHFEKEEQAIADERLQANKERCKIHQQFAPLPRQLQAATSKLEAVELELSSTTKQLEIINVDKLDLLTAKVKINRSITALQKEHGIMEQESDGPWLAAIDRITLLDQEIKNRQEELQRAEQQLVAEESDMICWAAMADKIQKARDALLQEQEAKLWAFHNLENHRKEYETFCAIKEARDRGLLMAGFIESKARVYEYWDDQISSQNDLLREFLQKHGVPLPCDLKDSVTNDGTALIKNHEGCADLSIELATERPKTPGRLVGLGPSFRSTIAFPQEKDRKKDVVDHSYNEGLSKWICTEAAKLSAASFDVVRRNTLLEERTRLTRSSLDQAISTSRKMDLGLIGKSERKSIELMSLKGRKRQDVDDTKLPPVKSQISVLDPDSVIIGSPLASKVLSMHAGGQSPNSPARMKKPSILYDSKGFPTGVKRDD